MYNSNCQLTFRVGGNEQVHVEKKINKLNNIIMEPRHRNYIDECLQYDRQY